MAGRLLILSSRVGSGHLTAAAALEQAFRRVPGLAVRCLDATAHSTRIHDLMYSGLAFPVARIAPWRMEWGYLGMHRPFAAAPLQRRWHRLNTARLMRLIRAFQPNHPVCTHFSHDDLILQQGDATDRFYIITRGSVELFLEQPDGARPVIDVLRQGQCFGEMGLMGDGCCNASARAAGFRDGVARQIEARFARAGIQALVQTEGDIRELITRFVSLIIVLLVMALIFMVVGVLSWLPAILEHL